MSEPEQLELQTSGQIAFQKAIDYFGSQNKLAKALGTSQPNIHNWLKGKVPAEWCPAIETVTGGLVTCSDLRPDVFRSLQ